MKEDIFYKLKEEAVPMHEWALLIFTICLQAAIGGVVMLALFYKRFPHWVKKKRIKSLNFL